MRCLICLDRYDTVVNNVWYGAALVISRHIVCDGASYLTYYIAADTGSTYSPAPLLTYEWDPDKQPNSNIIQPERTASGVSFDLGPHPADPHTTATHTTTDSHAGPNFHKKEVEGQEIYVFVDGNTLVSFMPFIRLFFNQSHRSFTFWRFYLEISLGGNEAEVTYHINNGQRLHFHVPGVYQNMRWAAHSVRCLFLYRLFITRRHSAMAFPLVSTLTTFGDLVTNQDMTLCGSIY